MSSDSDSDSDSDTIKSRKAAKKKKKDKENEEKKPKLDKKIQKEKKTSIKTSVKKSKDRDKTEHKKKKKQKHSNKAKKSSRKRKRDKSDSDSDSESDSKDKKDRKKKLKPQPKDDTVAKLDKPVSAEVSKAKSEDAPVSAPSSISTPASIPVVQTTETVPMVLDSSESKNIDATIPPLASLSKPIDMPEKQVVVVDKPAPIPEPSPVLPFNITVRRPGNVAIETREVKTPASRQGSEGQHVPLPELITLASPIDTQWEMGLHVTEKEEAQNLIVDNQFMTDDAKRKYKDGLQGHAPFPMAISLSNSLDHRELLGSERCRCKWKADGARRYLILSPSRPYWILVPRSWLYMTRIKETAYNEAMAKVNVDLWIIDGELIKGACSNGADLFVCHDVMMGNGKPLEDQPFDNRYKWLEWFRDAVLKKIASLPKRMGIVVGKFVPGKDIEQITKCLELVEPINKVGKTKMQILAETKMYYHPDSSSDPELFAMCGDKRLLCDGVFFQDGEATFNARDDRVRQAKWKLVNDVELQLRIENNKYVMYDVTSSRMNRGREVSVSTSISKDLVSPGI